MQNYQKLISTELKVDLNVHSNISEEIHPLFTKTNTPILQQHINLQYSSAW